MKIIYLVDFAHRKIDAYIEITGERFFVGPCVPPANFDWTPKQGTFYIPNLIPFIDEANG